MNANIPDSDPEPIIDMARYEPYLIGTVAEAWGKCIPQWQRLGRVNDFPRGIRKPGHTPCFESRLGWLFIQRFSGEYEFLLHRLATGSPLEAACAFDLLDFLSKNLWGECKELPECLRVSTLPLPAHVQKEVAADRIYRDHHLDTVGKLLEFEANGQSPPHT